MVMDFSKFRTAVEKQLTDEISIKRYVPKENADSTEDKVLPADPLYPAVPCRISFMGVESSQNASVDETPVKQQIKLICSVGADIQAGDYIVAKRLSGGVTLAQYEGNAGLPAVYESHKEVRVAVDRSA
jgi:hypothetical protein